MAGMAAATSLSTSDCSSAATAATDWEGLHCHRGSASCANSFRSVSSVPVRWAWIVGGNLMVKAALKKAVLYSPGGQYSTRDASTSDGRWLPLATTFRHLVVFWTGVSW